MRVESVVQQMAFAQRAEAHPACMNLESNGDGKESFAGTGVTNLDDLVE
jgi:hypothetical protein